VNILDAPSDFAVGKEAGDIFKNKKTGFVSGLNFVERFQGAQLF